MAAADDKPDFEGVAGDAPEVGGDWFDRLSPEQQSEHLAAVDRGIADGDAGRTVPWEDVKRWMLSWGTADELPCPRSRP